MLVQLYVKVSTSDIVVNLLLYNVNSIYYKYSMTKWKRSPE